MASKRLSDLKNVGPAALEDLAILGVTTVEELSGCDPTELFRELEKRTDKRHDPCVWDVFAAIIHEAKTGEATVWWKWTPQRKQLQNDGKIKHAVENTH